MVELRGISKYFPSNGVTALRNAGFTLRAGEIHALLGENGTGKSTLMHILAGYLTPSSGSILVDGKPRRFSAPADALALGIGMVRQHPGFIRGFKVWEDCILGAEMIPSRRRGLFLNPGFSRNRVLELSGRWNFDLPLDVPADSLTVGQRQKAAALALLLRNVKWFIFDEPTAVLTPGESEDLFELFRRLRSEGKGIAFITHKLDEALAIADRLTVIRKGVTQEPRNTAEISVGELERSVFGGDSRPLAEGGQLFVKGARRHDSHEDKPVLLINDLTIEPEGLPHIHNFNLCLMPGKILGITGVRDSGLETLELALSGLLEQQGRDLGNRQNGRACRYEGSIALNGHDITGRGVRAFREAGGAYLGADRLGGNLAPELPLKESLIIHAVRRARRGIFLDMGYLNSWCTGIMNRAGIARSVSDSTFSFSGGMLQRILLAREFAESASLLILAEAGSGLDQVNHSRLMEELRRRLRQNESAATLLFSTDLEELISVADEIMVLRNGKLIAWENNGA